MEYIDECLIITLLYSTDYTEPSQANPVRRSSAKLLQEVPSGPIKEVQGIMEVVIAIPYGKLCLVDPNKSVAAAQL